MGYKIISQSKRLVVIRDIDQNKVHKINVEKMTCDCKEFIFRKACKHLDFVARKLKLGKRVVSKLKVKSDILKKEKFFR